MNPSPTNPAPPEARTDVPRPPRIRREFVERPRLRGTAPVVPPPPPPSPRRRNPYAWDAVSATFSMQHEAFEPRLELTEARPDDDPRLVDALHVEERALHAALVQRHRARKAMKDEIAPKEAFVEAELTARVEEERLAVRHLIGLASADEVEAARRAVAHAKEQGKLTALQTAWIRVREIRQVLWRGRRARAKAARAEELATLDQQTASLIAPLEELVARLGDVWPLIRLAETRLGTRLDWPFHEVMSGLNPERLTQALQALQVRRAHLDPSTTVDDAVSPRGRRKR